ncbi:MAG: tetratricopeptide repeat protein, partial [Acidimicrobiaceae bacterium]|nr:tetratricopeptide repeat protein [Acidimicrobiaceae bacterium]
MEVSMSDQTVERLIAEGETLLKDERSQEALGVFERALELAPHQARAWNGKGLALSRLDRDEESLAAYVRATGEDMTYSGAWRNLGVQYR